MKTEIVTLLLTVFICNVIVINSQYAGYMQTDKIRDFKIKITGIKCFAPHEKRISPEEADNMDCQPTCPETKECRVFKTTRCICEDGYVRNYDFRCIKLNSCKKS
ncbi:hypothetical protein ILUMI_18077 [Ignelater luminosus]|uniref:Uncharacterized protein n=1 Tax=Ignelater luminosus TaxID=2038154 RepID=A0A8K0CPU8_IGNLU|nr:hypothetical protein ILUMI_18077 [Ignelater luminosus]